MHYRRQPIEIESPEEIGYGSIECNLSESSIWDARLGRWAENLDHLVLCYGEHRGIAELRERISESCGRGVRANDVLVVPGAAAGLFIVNSALLDEGSSVVVARPNYSTNIGTPRLIRSTMKYLDLRFEDRFEMDLERVAALLTPETRLVSVTYPHNPTGAVLSEEKLQALIEMVERNKCFLLVDETYRDLQRAPSAPLAATLSPRAISVSSLSKAFGLPGIRIGWVVTQNDELNERFLAAKEQIFICNSVLDEEIARRVMAERDQLLVDIRKRVESNYRIVADWINKQEHLEWIPPQGGVVSLPRMKPGLAVDTESFYRRLLEKYSTYVGPGHWFELSDRYFRLGYGWEREEKLIAGLRNISRALGESLAASA